jgi:hypothetical protein
MQFAVMLLVVLAVQPPTTHRIQSAPPCIPTEPMPVADRPRIAGDSGRVRRVTPIAMPIVHADSTRRLPMLVVKTPTCYQLDSMRRQ